MLKTYQFKSHCKGGSHCSKAANIILPGLMIKQRWTSLRLQAKCSSLFNFDEMSCFNQHNAVKWIWIPFHAKCSTAFEDLNTISVVTARTICDEVCGRFFTFFTFFYFFFWNVFYIYDFACRRKVVHLCFIMSPGKMILAVLELWLSPLQWVLNW